MGNSISVNVGNPGSETSGRVGRDISGIDIAGRPRSGILISGSASFPERLSSGNLHGSTQTHLDNAANNGEPKIQTTFELSVHVPSLGPVPVRYFSTIVSIEPRLQSNSGQTPSFPPEGHEGNPGKLPPGKEGKSGKLTPGKEGKPISGNAGTSGRDKSGTPISGNTGPPGRVKSGNIGSPGSDISGNGIAGRPRLGILISGSASFPERLSSGNLHGSTQTHLDNAANNGEPKIQTTFELSVHVPSLGPVPVRYFSTIVSIEPRLQSNSGQTPSFPPEGHEGNPGKLPPGKEGKSGKLTPGKEGKPISGNAGTSGRDKSGTPISGNTGPPGRVKSGNIGSPGSDISGNGIAGRPRSGILISGSASFPKRLSSGNLHGSTQTHLDNESNNGDPKIQTTFELSVHVPVVGPVPIRYDLTIFSIEPRLQSNSGQTFLSVGSKGEDSGD